MTTRFRKKLTNPLALMAQGFAVGSLLFWATMPNDAEAQAPVPASEIGHTAP